MNRIDRQILVLLCCAVIAWGVYCPGAVAAAANAGSPAASAGQDSGFYDRIMSILKTPPKLELPPPSPPVAVERKETPIFGTAEVTKDQMVRFIRVHNPVPSLTCSLEELVDIYYDEAGHEGIRPDLALAQAVLETGFFRFGGDVLPEQNNFAGIGTTGRGVRGEWFSSARMGIRAHIQHLLAYATTREPLHPIADPRYYIVRDLPANFAQCSTWESLSGKWAVPGPNYGQNILRIFERVKTQLLL